MGLSNDWTLARVRSEIQAQTSTLSQQESGIINSQLNDFIHHSLLSIRSAIDFLVDDDYRVSSTGATIPGTFSTSSSGYTDNSSDPIAAGTIYDLNINKMSLMGLTQFVGEIPIFTPKSFDAKRSVLKTYTSDFASTKGIATVYSTTTGTVVIAVYGNPAATTAPTFYFTYLRQPTRETTDGNTIDIPDKWVPLVVDHCTAQIFKKIGGKVPIDVEARMRADVMNIAQLINSNFNPQTVK